VRTIRVVLVAALFGTGLLAFANQAAATPAVSITPIEWSFGSQLVPDDGSASQPGTPKDFVVTNFGTVTTLSSSDATVTGTDASPTAAFEVTNDGCKGATLDTGQTCTVTVVAHPQAVGQVDGSLAVPVGPNTLSVSLRVFGQSTPAVTATGTAAAIDVVWNQLPQRGYLTSHFASLTVLRGTDPAAMTAIATGLPYGTTSYHDASVVPGTRYYYQVQEVRGGLPDITYPPTPVSGRAWTKGGAGTYYALPRPVRFLDTQTGNGAPRAHVAKGQTVHLQITGRGGVPASHVSAVVLNLTTVHPAAQTSLTAYASGGSRPLTQTLWANAGQTIDDNATVRIGAGGKIDIYNGQATTDIIADVYGFYTSDTALASTMGNGGQWGVYDDTPLRVLDSRSDGGALAPGFFYTPVIPFNDYARLHVHAVAVSITTLNATGSGALSAYSTGNVRSPSMLGTIRFAHGQVIQNMAILPVKYTTSTPSSPAQPYIAIANISSQSTHLVVDVLGFFDDGTLLNTSRYVPATTPQLVADSSKHVNLGNLGPGQIGTVDPGAAAVASTWALQMTVSAVRPTSNTNVGLWPDVSVDAGGPLDTPVNGRMQAPRGAITASAMMSEVGTNNILDIINGAGTTSVRVQVDGRFDIAAYLMIDWDYDPTFPTATAALKAARAAVTAKHVKGAAAKSGTRSAGVHVDLGRLSAQPDATVLR
jgi:hypothetical protein